MTELTCQQCHDLAAELALNVLTGRERARALAHLARCSGCRDTVSALTVTADRLVELIPDAEPPEGFAHRVMTALTPLPTCGRRWWRAVAAVLLAIAFAGGGWILGRSTHDVKPTENDAQADERTILFAPLTTGQRQIGQVYLYPDRPSWVYLSLDSNTGTASGSDTGTGIGTGGGSGTVRCELVRRDGSTVPAGTFRLIHGHGAWGGPAPVDRDTLDTARLINSSGHTLATARFPSPATHSDRPKRGSHRERRPGHP